MVNKPVFVLFAFFSWRFIMMGRIRQNSNEKYKTKRGRLRKGKRTVGDG